MPGCRDHVLHCCHGDDRPDHPISEALSATVWADLHRTLLNDHTEGSPDDRAGLRLQLPADLPIPFM